MKKCPICRIEMDIIQTKRGVFWECPSCKGITASIGFLRNNISDVIVNQFWQQARANHTPGTRKCPSCGRNMCVVQSTADQINQELDICKTCQLVWFDAEEFSVYDKKPLPETIYDGLSEEDKAKMLEAQLQLNKELFERRNIDEKKNSIIINIIRSLIFRFIL